VTNPETKFRVALDELIEEVKKDRSVLAALLCGSLSHDTVWDKSDIDLALITIDDRKVERGGRSLYANGVNVHAMIVTRSEFRKTVEAATHNSFLHSLFAKGRLLYTHDESIAEMCERLKDIGARDTQISLLRAGIGALGSIYKAHKWLVTRGDLDYTALWLIYSATPLARVEILSHRLLADREVIPQALKLNPEFFSLIYTDLLNRKKTRTQVETALAAVDTYIADRAPTLFQAVFDYLRDAGEIRTCTEIENHFARNHDVEGVTAACEYLSDQGLIGKASVAVQLTGRSNVTVPELAFFHLQK
jgi:predicted nucleotidyltransferase